MTGYTAPELVLILTALTALIVQSITAWRTSRKVDKVAGAIAENTDISNTLKTELAVVHVATNSNLAAVKADLEIAVQRVAALVAVVEDLRAERERDRRDKL